MSYFEYRKLIEEYKLNGDENIIEKCQYDDTRKLLVNEIYGKGSVFYKILNSLRGCSETFIRGECNICFKEYLKTLFCGLPYCENEHCQKITQIRRRARLKDRFLQLGDIGYWIFTIPYFLRESITIEKIKMIHKKLKYQMKKIFPDLLCIGRWHWFSEDYPDRFNPHLNLLVNMSHLAIEIIDKVKLEYKKILGKVFGLNIKVCVVWYNFFVDSREKLHKLVYVFRNTFLKLKGNEKWAVMIFKFRNAVSYGKFKKLTDIERWELGEEYRDLPEVFGESESVDIDCEFPKGNEKLELSQCVFCDGQVQWTNSIIYFVNTLVYYKLSVYFYIANVSRDDYIFLEQL